MFLPIKAPAVPPTAEESRRNAIREAASDIGAWIWSRERDLQEQITETSGNVDVRSLETALAAEANLPDATIDAEITRVRTAFAAFDSGRFSAARALKLSRATLYRKIKQLKIETAQ